MKLTNNSLIKNKLIQYKGGGYDGCHWEWNWFLFDSEGSFHNLASTGCMGVKDLAEAIETLNGDGHYVYKLNKAGIEAFVTECNDMCVNHVSKMINKAYGEDLISIKCPICEQKTDPEYMVSTGYSGNGGVGIVELDYVCGDCHCSGSCGHCGDYHGTDYNPDDGWATLEETIKQLKAKFNIEEITAAYKSEDENCGPYCQYCMLDQIEKELNERN